MDCDRRFTDPEDRRNVRPVEHRREFPAGAGCHEDVHSHRQGCRASPRIHFCCPLWCSSWRSSRGGRGSSDRSQRQGYGGQVYTRSWTQPFVRGPMAGFSFISSACPMTPPEAPYPPSVFRPFALDSVFGQSSIPPSKMIPKSSLNGSKTIPK